MQYYTFATENYHSPEVVAIREDLIAVASKSQIKEYVIYRFEVINNLINQIKAHNNNTNGQIN